jgi:hypothetical protein
MRKIFIGMFSVLSLFLSDLSADTESRTGESSAEQAASVPKIRGVLVPLQEDVSSPSNIVFTQSSESEANILDEEPLEEPEFAKTSPDRWPEDFIAAPEEPTPSEIRGVLIPLEEVESTTSTLVDAPIEESSLENEDTRVTIHKSLQTIIFSTSEEPDVQPITIVSERREKNPSVDEPMKRNVFANISIAALSAAVIFVSALLGSH